MSTDNSHTTRRAFFVKGSATLGAGVAAAAGAGALATSASASPQPAAAAEREAILRVHQGFIAGVEKGLVAAADASHQAYRSNARQHGDRLAISEDGARAQATWHVDVKRGSLLEGDSTAAQMARLQGMLSDLRWESGVIDARYEKRAGQWRISALQYRSAG